jgi:hypothetical protein
MADAGAWQESTRGLLYFAVETRPEFQQLPGARIGRRSEPMPAATPVPGWQPSLFELEAS